MNSYHTVCPKLPCQSSWASDAVHCKYTAWSCKHRLDSYDSDTPLGSVSSRTGLERQLLHKSYTISQIACSQPRSSSQVPNTATPLEPDGILTITWWAVKLGLWAIHPLIALINQYDSSIHSQALSVPGPVLGRNFPQSWLYLVLPDSIHP